MNLEKRNNFVRKSNLRILIYLAHPAQYHFFKYIVKNLREKGHIIKYLIRTKDILEDLLLEDNQEYLNILPRGRKSNILGIFWGLIKREFAMVPIIKSFKPNILMGSEATTAHLGKLFNIPVFTILEDDYDVIPLLSKTTFPFTKYILAPEICNCGKWNYKKISYNGYMKLSYLHPDYFKPRLVSEKKYILIRLSKLDAHHDKKIKGINKHILKEIIKISRENSFDIKITSEKPLESEFQEYLIKPKSTQIHDYLYNASIFISDSQSMSVESSILGTPSIRYSSFVGRISVLEELEHKYKLTFGINPHDSNELFITLDSLIKTKNLKQIFHERRDLMLRDKINVTEFFTWLIDEYPESIEKIKLNPSYQYNFKQNIKLQ